MSRLAADEYANRQMLSRIAELSADYVAETMRLFWSGELGAPIALDVFLYFMKADPRQREIWRRAGVKVATSPRQSITTVP